MDQLWGQSGRVMAAFAAVAALALAGCSAHNSAPAPIGTQTSTVTATATPTSTPPSTASAPGTPVSSAPGSGGSTGSPGPIVGTGGSYLSAPAQPTDLPANNDCHALVADRTSDVHSCTTASSARGTITAVAVQDGMSVYVHVYRRSGNQAIEVLRSTVEVDGTGPLSWQVATIDPEHDGNPKIALVLLNEPSGSVRGYDLVDVPGVVTMHRTLGTGAVALASGGGLIDWTVEASKTFRTTLRYSDGQWRIAGQQSDQPLPKHLVDF